MLASHGPGTRRAGGKGPSDPCTGISTSVTVPACLHHSSLPCPELWADTSAFPSGSLLQFGASPGAPQDACWGLERAWELSATARTSLAHAAQPARAVGRGTRGMRGAEGWGLLCCWLHLPQPCHSCQRGQALRCPARGTRGRRRYSRAGGKGSLAAALGGGGVRTQGLLPAVCGLELQATPWPDMH